MCDGGNTVWHTTQYCQSLFCHKQDGGSGFVAVRTDRYIIFGSYSSAMYPSVCVEAVESLGE